MVTEFIAWDNAVKLAKDFANQNGKTAVLALPDHSTGGIKVGNYKHNYLDLTPEFARQPLLNMKMTSLGVVKMMENESKEALKKSVSNNWGINLTDEDLTKIWEYCDLYKMEYQSNPGFKFGYLPLNHALSRIVSEEYTIAGWTSHGHNGEEVPMWTHGVRDFPKGMIRNIDVGKLVGSMLGGVERLKDQLYVDVSTIGLNYHVELSDIKNQYAIIEEHVFPLNTDYFLHQNGTRIYLPGITVHAPMTNKLYVHSKFIEMIKK
jgi:alkaline phosphatase